MESRPSALFLMGPTASGKTELALVLHQQLPVEIISVDATQVYRGLDIGSAKPPPEVLAKVPHRLLDIRDPAEPYSAAEFAKDAGKAMAEISAAGRIPLLVGGTMLYFKVLLQGLANLPPANKAVRQALEQEAEHHGWPHLHRQLQKIDPELAATLHPNHSRRIQRALEIYRITGQPPSALRRGQRARGQVAPVTDDYQVIQFAVAPRDRASLHQRIAKRFCAMMDQGLIKEVKALRSRGDLSLALPAMQAAGYRQVWQYLDGALTEQEMWDKALSATRQLAKRQLTWLRQWPAVHWLYTETEAHAPVPTSQLAEDVLKILQSTPIYIEKGR